MQFLLFVYLKLLFSMSYAYWNGFIDSWRDLVSEFHDSLDQEVTICEWSNPNNVPLLNSENINDYSFKYLPEPWWGNNGEHPLNSVVINYNPGQAVEMHDNALIQHFEVAGGLFGYGNFGEFANDEAIGSLVFHRTNQWHFSRRASVIYSALQRAGIHLDEHGLCNHLSIEMIPWHTKNIRNVNPYILNNIERVYEYCFAFAAEQSRNIVNNNPLHNKVLIRSSSHNLLPILNTLNGNGYPVIVNNDIPIMEANPEMVIHVPVGGPVYEGGRLVTGQGRYFKFHFDNALMNDVQFIVIWGVHSRNNFPPSGDMDWIFANGL